MTTGQAEGPFGVQFCVCLRARGVETVFGIPGVHNQELYRGLSQSGIRHILARHEQGACFMADGYARLSQKPGAAFVITGPGLTNGLTAIGQAYSDSVPVLVIATCLEMEQRRLANGCLHKLKDQEAAGEAVAGWSLTAEDPQEAFALADRAFQEFAGQRSRPKIINLPVSLLSAPSPPSPPPPPLPPLPAADQESMGHCAELVRRSRRPLFVFGGGAAGAADEARRLLRLTSAAAFTTYAGRGIVPAGFEFSFGSHLARPESAAWIASADLILAVGTELSEVDLWRGALGHSAPMVRIDIDPEVLRQSGGRDLPIQGDARKFLSDLHSRLAGGQFAPGWSKDEVERARREFRASCDSERPGIAGVAENFWKSMPPDTAVFSDMTQFAYAAKETLQMEMPGSWHHPSGFGTLGYALPAAIGGKTGCPDRPVLAIAGDYGIQFTIQELGTAAELGLPLPIVVWDNQRLQEISDGMVRAQIEPAAVSPLNPEFSSLAAAYGLRFAKPDSVSELSSSVIDAFRADRPTLIHADAGRLIRS